MFNFLNSKTQKMSAALMTGAMVGTFGDVAEVLAKGVTGSERSSLNTYLGQTSGRVNEVPNLVAFISYIGGTALAALGVVNLKQHVENPSQTPMKNGLAKLGFGGMLLALPTITNNMLGTASGGGEATMSKFTAPKF